MNDPYKIVFDEIAKAIQKQTKMIAWLAERTMSVKDYLEFTEEFKKKKEDDDIISCLKETM